MATVKIIRADIRDILAAVKAKLVADEVAPDNKILWVARKRDVPRFTGDQDLLLCPRGFRANQETVSGAGRAATEVSRFLDVYVRVRLALDAADSDEQWLLHTSKGYFNYENAVIASLQMFLPLDGDGNGLTVQPLRVMDASDPQKGNDDPLWGDAVLSFELVYDIEMTVDEDNQ